MTDFGKDISCLLCGNSACADGWAEARHDDDVYDGKWPWHRYRISPCKQYKIPRDPYCLCCHTVFATSSMKIKHGSPKKYLAYVSGRPEEHATFKKAVKKMIDECNADVTGVGIPQLLKLYAKKEQPLETVSEE